MIAEKRIEPDSDNNSEPAPEAPIEHEVPENASATNGGANDAPEYRYEGAPPPPKPTIGSRLKWLRVMRDDSLGVVSAVTGLARPWISQIENGSKTASLDALVTLAHYYDVNVEWIATGNGIPAPYPRNSEEAEFLRHFQRIMEPPVRAEMLALAKQAADISQAKRDWVTRPWLLLEPPPEFEARSPFKRDRRRR